MDVEVEVAVAGKEPVGSLEDEAGVELAVEDPEAVEVAEVVVDNQGKNLKDILITLILATYFASLTKKFAHENASKNKDILLCSRVLCNYVCETVECLKCKRILEDFTETLTKKVCEKNEYYGEIGKMSHRYRFYLCFVDSSGVLTEEILVLLCVPLKERSHLHSLKSERSVNLESKF